MSEKPLLLHSAKTAVLVERRDRPAHHYVRWGALLLGLLCVLVGAADITARLSEGVLGDRAAQVAFAPAAAIGNPALFATTTAATLVPATLSVPSIGVKADVELVGKKADGSMGTPQNFKDVAWYSLGSKPGESGSAVFDGHVNNALTQSGVFSNLSKVQKGDYVSIADAKGKTLVYQVSETKVLTPEADTAVLFATSGPQQIVLITCDGEWVQDEHQFSERLVVIAKPAY